MGRAASDGASLCEVPPAGAAAGYGWAQQSGGQCGSHMQSLCFSSSRLPAALVLPPAPAAIMCGRSLAPAHALQPTDAQLHAPSLQEARVPPLHQWVSASALGRTLSRLQALRMCAGAPSGALEAARELPVHCWPPRRRCCLRRRSLSAASVSQSLHLHLLPAELPLS